MAYNLDRSEGKNHLIISFCFFDSGQVVFCQLEKLAKFSQNLSVFKRKRNAQHLRFTYI